jgi:hypothetical protein
MSIVLFAIQNYYRKESKNWIIAKIIRYPVSYEGITKADEGLLYFF